MNWVVSRGPPATANSFCLPPDRNFPWNPGLTSKGGPSGAGILAVSGGYTQSGGTLTPIGGGADDTTQIQNALNAATAKTYVKLGSGTFSLTASQTPIIVPDQVILRGSGAGSTILQKSGSGAALGRAGTTVSGTTINTPATQPGTIDNAPIIIVGPGRFAGVDNHDQNSAASGSTSSLTADGIRGSYSITVADGTIFTVGRCVLLDELSNASYIATPRGFLDNNTNGTEGTVQVLAGDRFVANRHTPTQTFQDDPPDSCGWFSRPDPINVATGSYTDGRFTCEIKEIAAINGNLITFTSPLSITYRVSHVAQLTRYTSTPATGNSVHIKYAGVEDLTLQYSGGGGIFFNCAAYCWAKRVEIDSCFGLGIAFINSFRCELRASYIHTSAEPTPAADSYAVSPQLGSSEILIENCILRDYCKAAGAFRACGAGSVFAYNYTDDGWDWYNTGNSSQDAAFAAFQECGINASHMGGCHHVLFEGNYSFNADSDYTHGNSIYITMFRNWLTGTRTSFTGETNKRCGGGAMFSYYRTFIGNVLGRSGAMSGWTYTDARMGCDSNGGNCVGSPANGWTNSLAWNASAIWMVGYDPERFPCGPDSLTLGTLIRDGNYDFVTNSQKWHNTPATFVIPASLYLSTAPKFFGTNTWPWVDPATGTTYTLPAKARYDGGTPNTVPNE